MSEPELLAPMPSWRRQTAGLLACFAVAVGVLGSLLEDVTEQETQIWDRHLRPPLHWQAGAGEVVLRVVGAFSTIGAGPVLLTAAGVLVAWFAAQRRWYDVIFVVGSFEVARLVERVLKVVVHEPRPTPTLSGYFLPAGVKAGLCLLLLGIGVAVLPRRWSCWAWLAGGTAAFLLVDEVISRRIPLEHGFDSFPSGHATSSMTMAMVVVILGWPTRFRPHLALLAVFFVAGVGLSRVLLGYHVLTDVLGGWAVGIAVTTWLRCALTVTASMSRRRNGTGLAVDAAGGPLGP